MERLILNKLLFVEQTCPLIVFNKSVMILY